jgi:hypothetical protein
MIQAIAFEYLPKPVAVECGLPEWPHTHVNPKRGQKTLCVSLQIIDERILWVIAGIVACCRKYFRWYPDAMRWRARLADLFPYALPVLERAAELEHMSPVQYLRGKVVGGVVYVDCANEPDIGWD